jgi:hypothetical protein
MAANKQLKDIVEIRFEAEYAELKLRESVINFILDKQLPQFPDSMTKELPPYILEMVEKMMPEMRADDISYAKIHLYVEHESECAELKETGMCNCRPSRYDYTFDKYIQTLTCVLCGESASGQLGGTSSAPGSFKVGVYEHYDKIVGKFWSFAWDDYKKNICDYCVSQGKHYIPCNYERTGWRTVH